MATKPNCHWKVEGKKCMASKCKNAMSHRCEEGTCGNRSENNKKKKKRRGQKKRRKKRSINKKKNKKIKKIYRFGS